MARAWRGDWKSGKRRGQQGSGGAELADRLHQDMALAARALHEFCKWLQQGRYASIIRCQARYASLGQALAKDQCEVGLACEPSSVRARFLCWLAMYEAWMHTAALVAVWLTDEDMSQYRGYRKAAIVNAQAHLDAIQGGALKAFLQLVCSTLARLLRVLFSRANRSRSALRELRQAVQELKQFGQDMGLPLG